ncbi:DUF2889 domain-containing protein [Paraburkholderia dipogonis]|uniref:DUF2889 domain-containing protein n=1 Tax=Paraburkholderia dipogonis TaxID=1211383 RepID=UPI0038BAF8DF
MNPTAVARKLLHTRHVACHAYQRSDGLIDIEAELRDITPDGTDLFFKILPAGMPIHDMRILMTVNQKLVVQAVTAQMRATPTPYCPKIESAYAALAGLQIGAGWRTQVKARVGGMHGCTHLTELILGTMATTAVQASLAIERASPDWPASLKKDVTIINSCHSYRSDGEAAKILWSEQRREQDSSGPVV